MGHPRRIRRLHALRDEIAEWAARRHPDQLEAGMRTWLGSHDASRDRVMQAIAFALVAAPPGGVSLVERYAREVGARSRADRDLFASWARTRFSVFEVERVDLDRGFALFDVMSEQRCEVRERAATHHLSAGDWVLCFVQPVDGEMELEGTLTLVPQGARFDVVHAMVAAGHDPARPGTAWPALQALNEALRPPRFVNADGHPILVITATLDETWRAVARLASTWPDAIVDDMNVDVLGTDDDRLGGPIRRACFQVEGDVVTLHTNSRARQEEVLARWEASTGRRLRIVREEVHDPESAPDGREMLVDSARIEGDSDADPDDLSAQYVAAADQRWLDQAIPSLDGQTPREAVASGRRSEVRALLPADARGLALRVALGL